jgi:GH25 family lysozyme M1 (1,4-beta-N-acetylmuramidase)
MNWEQLRGLGYSFAYVRGVRMGKGIDVNAVEHVARARAAGLRVGLYGFFVPTIPAADQFAVMLDAHQACGMRHGDLAPALDVESYTGAHAAPTWVAGVRELLDAYHEQWGAAVRYHNVADWYAMGKPSCLERFALWLADYTPPADLPCAIWQVRSAPIHGYGTTPLDQNVAHGELPTIGRSDVETVLLAPLEDAYHRLRAAAGRALEYVR